MLVRRMSHRVNDGTDHMFWQLSAAAYSANVRVIRDYRRTVAVQVSNNGFAMSHQLSPREARDMAEALLELATAAEASTPQYTTKETP